MDIVLTGSNVTVGLGQPTWVVDGDGDCTFPGHELIAGTLDGELTGLDTTSAGCAAGIYKGLLTFSAVPAIDSVDSILVDAVMEGPVLHITMVTPPTFAGTGVFAQLDTGTTLACATEGNETTSWSGVFVVEDPVLP